MNYETATILAIVLGPFLAVAITLWHQDRAQKLLAKRQLFNILMANRRAYPPAREWVNALNLIDVIFADEKAVVSLWHRLYDILNRAPMVEEQFRHVSLDLLQQMARSLGYRELKQTDIDKFYVPQIHGDMAARSAAVQEEFLQMARNVNAIAAAAQGRATVAKPAEQFRSPTEPKQ